MRAIHPFACLAILIAGSAPAFAQDLVAVAPDAAKVEYEDARVRIVRLRMPPHTSSPMHDRPARIVVPLLTSDARLTRPDGATSVSRSVAGTAAWSGPTKRSVTNLDSPIENIIVELKQATEPAKPLAAPPAPRPAGFLEPDRFHTWLFENQYVRVYDARIPPGETTGFHVHGFDSVSVLISGGLIATQAQGQPWKTAQRIAPGSVEFSADAKQPRTHRVRNEGTAEYHVVVVQLLSHREDAKLRRNPTLTRVIPAGAAHAH